MKIDYRQACFKLADRLNDIWRKKYHKKDNEYKYTFEFLPADSVYMHASGFIAQISYNTSFGFFQVVQSKTDGLIIHGCDTSDEAFKSMIDNYLEKANDNDIFLGGDPHDYPKTIKEIMK